MSKYIIFYPSDLDMKDEPKETVLWEVKYKLHDSILGLPDILTNLLKQEMTKTYPLSFWHNEFVNMNMQLIYDYIYAKEYAYFVDNIPVFTATVTALDLNRFNNEVVLKQKIAKKNCAPKVGMVFGISRVQIWPAANSAAPQNLSLAPK